MHHFHLFHFPHRTSDKRNILRAERIEAQKRLVGAGRRSASGVELVRTDNACMFDISNRLIPGCIPGQMRERVYSTLLGRLGGLIEP